MATMTEAERMAAEREERIARVRQGLEQTSLVPEAEEAPDVAGPDDGLPPVVSEEAAAAAAEEIEWPDVYPAGSNFDALETEFGYRNATVLRAIRAAIKGTGFVIDKVGVTDDPKQRKLTLLLVARSGLSQLSLPMEAAESVVSLEAASFAGGVPINPYPLAKNADQLPAGTVLAEAGDDESKIEYTVNERGEVEAIRRPWQPHEVAE